MAKDQDAVLTTVEGNIGLIAINNAPVNALGAAVRLGLQSAIKTLSDNPELNVIAIYGEGRCLSAGADIREFGKAPIGPPFAGCSRRHRELSGSRDFRRAWSNPGRRA